ncbi:MAG: hypothetical protein FJX59_19715 [Alphaproteobacteria bacterium]|nr:hypothetical protein [Alphaproteobacteria bacterium]
MKRFLVILILFILIGGGGVGGMIMLGMLPNPFNPSKQGEGEEAAAAAAKAEKAAKPFEPPPAVIPFVDMRDLIIPVIVNGQKITQVYLSVRLWIAPGAKDAVEMFEPRFENEVIKEFTSYFSVHFEKNDSINLPEVKRRFVKIAKAVHGDNVRDVLLINVFEQSFGALN